MVGFDEYDRKARLTPGLLAIIPMAFVVITLGLKRYPAIAISTGMIGGAGGAYLLAVLVRHMGRLVEPELWSSWGGRPTTRFLRTREIVANPILRDVWRDAIEGVTGVRLLSAEEESVDPSAADNTIEAAVSQVLRLGQDERYSLVKAENIQYGFERNFYAVRSVGRAIAAVSTLILLVVLASRSHLGINGVSIGALIAGIVIDSAFCVGWLLLPSAQRAKLASERYAQQLFQTITTENRHAREAGGKSAPR
jgi:hypothetical protein